MGTMKDIEAKVVLEDDCTPKFYRPRPVAYALREKVEQELDRLQRAGVISPVDSCEWATPIVPVVKKSGDIRICGDFKVTINPVLNVETYPLPKIEDIFSQLAGGTSFSKLDLAHAYQQMKVNEASKPYLTINTHKGLFVCNCLPFGVASAPAIYQKAMEQIIQGLPGVQVYLDDILCTGATEQEHLSNLDKLLTRLEQFGLRVKRSKCEFFKPSITYLGHKIDAQGLHATSEKIQAIVDTKPPRSVEELRSFLGLLNYYGRFLPMISTVLQPLNNLLSSKVKWKWTTECEDSFQKAKDLIVSNRVLTHYDLNLPITLACDASSFGIGAVISHHFPNGEEKPTAFASKTLNSSQQNYSQLEKEALSIIFGVKKFYQYLYGRKFSLITDHHPLTTIFGPKNAIPSMAAARLQRWALFLSGFKYDISYKNTKLHGNADMLSRLPSPSVCDPAQEDPLEVHLLGMVDDHLPVSSSMISQETRRDPLLCKVHDFILNGWPVSVDQNSDYSPYYNRRNELTVIQGYLPKFCLVALSRQRHRTAR